MRRPGPRHKICRRVGAPVCGRPNCPTARRPYPPGQHGRGRQKRSEYYLSLLEKQKLRATYGIRERQLRRFLEEARRMRGVLGENLLLLLERRLDNVIRRLGFATTIAQARQLVSHGHVRVNGRRVDRPSYVLNAGDAIDVDPKDMLHVQEAVAQTPDVPGYVERDGERLTGRLARIPSRDEIPYPVTIDERLVVEYYAR